MRALLAGAALMGLVACQPAANEVQREAPAAEPVAAAPVAPVEAVVFPQPTGPVANYFQAGMPVSFQGRWAADAAACASGQGVVTIGESAIVSDAMSAALGDVEMNTSDSVIIDIVAQGKFTVGGQTSDARASMRRSVDGSRLLVAVMGVQDDAGLPGDLRRCP